MPLTEAGKAMLNTDLYETRIIPELTPEIQAIAYIQAVMSDERLSPASRWRISEWTADRWKRPGGLV